MTRSRALEAVSAVERRLRVAAMAATAVASEAAGQQLLNRAAFARALQDFEAHTSRSAFACAAVHSLRTVIALAGAELSARQRAADESVRAAIDALMPWAQMRCGLKRRRARLAANTPS